MKTKTSFGGDNQPTNKRGKAKKTLLLESIQRYLDEQDIEVRDREHAEELFTDKFVELAYTGAAIGENTLFNEMVKRLHPAFKPTNEAVVFEFPESGTPLEKFNAIMTAVSNGDIPPDIGATLANVINTGVNIQDVTELKAKIEEIEKAMKADA